MCDRYPADGRGNSDRFRAGRYDRGMGSGIQFHDGQIGREGETNALAHISRFGWNLNENRGLSQILSRGRRGYILRGRRVAVGRYRRGQSTIGKAAIIR